MFPNRMGRVLCTTNGANVVPQMTKCYGQSGWKLRGSSEVEMTISWPTAIGRHWNWAVWHSSAVLSIREEPRERRLPFRLRGVEEVRR